MSEENINRLVFGGIYKADMNRIGYHCNKYTDDLNDQKYGIWVPVHRYDEETKKHTYYMVDTYQLSRNLFKYSSNKEEEYQNLIDGLERLNNPEEKGNWASYMPFDYYYSARVELTNRNFDIFTLIADLHDYRISNDNEVRNYNEDDVLEYIKLYNEHAYRSDGIILVRKNAKINYEYKINAKIQDLLADIKEPREAYNNYINDLLDAENEAIENKGTYNQKRVKAVIEYNKFVQKLREKCNKYFNEHRDEIFEVSHE